MGDNAIGIRMYRDTKTLTKTSQVLLYLLAAKGIVDRMRMAGQLRYALYPEYAQRVVDRRISNILHKLIRHGWIYYEYKESKQIVKLTSRGELEALFQKASLPDKEVKWDQKWQIAVFDIPEDARHIRARLRKLLKGFGFIALQASVYVYPFAISTAAINFLKQSGLMRYVRFARVEAFDDDADLRKKFKRLIALSDGRQKEATVIQ